jgi:hypothetical protein
MVRSRRLLSLVLVAIGVSVAGYKMKNEIRLSN